MSSHVPLDTQQKLLELRLDNDESIIDGWERHLEQKFAMLAEFRSALQQIAKPIQFLQETAESKGETLNTLEAKRMANSATWLQEIAYNSLRANPDDVKMGDFIVSPQKVKALIIAAGHLIDAVWPDPLFAGEEKELNSALADIGYITKHEFNRRKEQNDERSVAENPQ